TVRRTSGAVGMRGGARAVVGVERYRSTPMESRFVGWNASAGFKNLICGISGNRGGAAGLMVCGATSFGSSTSNGKTLVVSGAFPNTPGPMKDSRSVCAGGVTQNVAVEKPRESRVLVGRMPGRG